MTANTAIETTTATVTIVSIWSKWDSLEGKLSGRDKNVTYEVEVEVEVGATSETILEAAFHATNVDERPLNRLAASTTSGDLMVLNDRTYLVQPFGFKELTREEAVRVKALSSRDTSFGYDFLVKQGLI